MTWDKLIQYGIFAAVGGAGSLVAIILTYIFTEWLGWWYIFSYVVGTVLAWTFNFYFHSLVTFRGHSKEGYHFKYLKFLTLYVVAFAINVTLVYVLTSIIGVYYILSIILVTTLISAFTFWSSKNQIFIYDQVS